ncbi:MAG: DNA mismatch repair protein MutS, partial [Clostridia bacterium]|nr:DNA mismatch repair protein MutS [Clostridia bacterium]
QHAVGAFLKYRPESDALKSELRALCDIERVAGRIVYGSANCRDLRALYQVTQHLPEIKRLVSVIDNEYLSKLASQIDELSDIGDLIDAAIVVEPPFTVREGGMFKKGFNPEVDRLKELLDGGASRLAEIEQREKERTNIPKLKVGYNRVFGYYIEVSKSFMDQTPADYIRKQTLANCERYITPELKELEGEVVSAGDKLCALEYELFTSVRNAISEQADRIKMTARAIAAVDVLRSFAVAAEKYNYVMPLVDNSDRIDIKDGRHPVVERVLNGGMFVPNDTLLDCGENRVYVITSPNMAGKSTFMRQVALITIMAQCGSFVPASSANIGVCDRVFTRIGASDDMMAGQSTFMVEMNEVAEIIKHATSKSLLILDEIGRGTSTYDGMAIARSVLEYCAGKKLGARTLFATHYHELCAMEGSVQGVKNYNIVVKKHGDSIVFIKKIVRGGTNDSYGIDVAKLAGIPDSVIKRAKEVLTEIEDKMGAVKDPAYTPISYEEEAQVSFGSYAKDELIEKLKLVEPDVLSPIEALSMLYDMVK